MKKIILSAAFLGLGVFAMAQDARAVQVKKHDFKQSREARIEKMKTELNLTDAQVAQLKDLYAKNAEQMQKNAEERKHNRMEMMKKNEEDLQKILTPEQLKKYQELKERKKATMMEKMKARKSAKAVAPAEVAK